MISYIIITRGERYLKTLCTLKSIALSHEGTDIDYEIIMVGNVHSFYEWDVYGHHAYNMRYKITHLLSHQPCIDGNLGAGRNHGAQEAKGVYLVFLDDDILLSPGFVKDLFVDGMQYELQFSFIGTKLLLPDGGRFWDWATYEPHRMYDYSTELSKRYVNSGCFIINSEVWNKHRWIENEHEIPYCKMLNANGYYPAFNHAIAWHWSHEYKADELAGIVRREPNFETCDQFVRLVDKLGNMTI